MYVCVCVCMSPQAGENDVIRDASGRPVEFGTAALGAEGSGQTVTPVDGCLTYEQLAQVGTQ